MFEERFFKKDMEVFHMCIFVLMISQAMFFNWIDSANCTACTWTGWKPCDGTNAERLICCPENIAKQLNATYKKVTVDLCVSWCVNNSNGNVRLNDGVSKQCSTTPGIMTFLQTKKKKKYILFLCFVSINPISYDIKSNSLWSFKSRLSVKVWSISFLRQRNLAQRYDIDSKKYHAKWSKTNQHYRRYKTLI